MRIREESQTQGGLEGFHFNYEDFSSVVLYLQARGVLLAREGILEIRPLAQPSFGKQYLVHTTRRKLLVKQAQGKDSLRLLNEAKVLGELLGRSKISPFLPRMLSNDRLSLISIFQFEATPLGVEKIFQAKNIDALSCYLARLHSAPLSSSLKEGLGRAPPPSFSTNFKNASLKEELEKLKAQPMDLSQVLLHAGLDQSCIGRRDNGDLEIFNYSYVRLGPREADLGSLYGLGLRAGVPSYRLDQLNYLYQERFGVRVSFDLVRAYAAITLESEPKLLEQLLSPQT